MSRIYRATSGPGVEWQVLATEWLKLHVSFQSATAGRPMAEYGWGAAASVSAGSADKLARELHIVGVELTVWRDDQTSDV